MAAERGVGFAADKIGRWGRYAGDPTPGQLIRYFQLSPTDLEHARRRRSPLTQLGYGVQLGTVRFLGTFTAAASTPRTVIAEIARQLDVDESLWRDYVASRAREVHQVDIRLEHGYHVFGQGTAHVAFLRWLWDRAWTGDDSASQLLDLATGWLVGKAALSDAPTGHVGRHWTALVFRENGTLDAGAYTLCTLDALRLAIRRGDVFVPDALRWGDPRRLLLDKTSWKRTGASVKRFLDLDGGPRRLLARLGRELDDAYAHAGEVLTGEPGLLATDRTHERFKVPPLDAEPLPASTELLRDRIASLIPTSELPEVLLEVDAWTGFTQAFLPATGNARSPDLALSICAALLVQACNVPYTAVSRRDVPALTEARLKWVEANYLRADTITAANTRLVRSPGRHPARPPVGRRRAHLGRRSAVRAAGARDPRWTHPALLRHRPRDHPVQLTWPTTTSAGPASSSPAPPTTASSCSTGSWTTPPASTRPRSSPTPPRRATSTSGCANCSATATCRAWPICPTGDCSGSTPAATTGR